ncbi:hypothetical protein Salat_0679300 [Sesamum alatum]|uniref:Uncharacterized protein n=1 Tax=Sesamum alatum TaxID=300844 RepID=A0AAE1YRP5_9LAMI|nr:hypothetical protein Salat_0679300 [Sesamum alatum]
MPQTHSQQQLYSSPSRSHTQSQQGTESSPTTHNEPSIPNSSTIPVLNNCIEKGPVVVREGRGVAQFSKGWGTGNKLEVTLDRNQRVIGPNVNHYKTTIRSKSVVLADLKDIWRRWKHKIKMKYFLPHIDDPQYLSQLPTERVEQDQWNEFVIYWTDEDVEKISRKNSVNVFKKKCLHRIGRTSFAVMEQEMVMKGTDPSTLDIWLDEHFTLYTFVGS